MHATAGFKWVATSRAGMANRLMRAIPFARAISQQLVGRRRIFRVCAAALCLWFGARPANAAVFYTSDFDEGLDGWTQQSGGPMMLDYSSEVGHPAGSLHGSFAEQTEIPVSETDSFHADSSTADGAFTGNYWLDVPGFTSWSFNFYADDVLPSDLIIRFGNGVNTFVYNALPQVSAIDTWYTVNISLSYAGWFGGSPTMFSNVLNNVTFVEVQFSRNGTEAQDYYLDNFSLNGSQGGGNEGGGGSSAVPEPGSGLLVLAGIGFLSMRRRYMRMRRDVDETGGGDES